MRNCQSNLFPISRPDCLPRLEHSIFEKQPLCTISNWCIIVLGNEDFLNNPTVTYLSHAGTTSHPIEWFCLNNSQNLFVLFTKKVPGFDLFTTSCESRHSHVQYVRCHSLFIFFGFRSFDYYLSCSLFVGILRVLPAGVALAVRDFRQSK